MKKKLLLVVAFLSALPFGLKAQSITDHYALLYSGMCFTFFEEDEGVSDQGFNAGVLFGYNITKKAVPLFLQFGGELIYEGTTDDGVEERLACLAAPVNLSYKLGHRKFNVEPYIGVNFRLNIHGNAKGEANSVKTDIDYFDSAVKARRFQFGANLGLNFNILDFTAGIRVNSDFTEYAKNVDSKVNRIMLTVGYSM
jgi:hypothetical protein